MIDRERIYRKQELVENLTNSFISDLREYRKAVWDEEASGQDGVQASGFEEHLRRLATRFEGGEVRLARREYWGFVVKARIEAVGAIGGLDFMRGIYETLEKHSANSEYEFAAGFDELADGIYGWYRAI